MAVNNPTDLSKIQNDSVNLIQQKDILYIIYSFKTTDPTEDTPYRWDKYNKDFEWCESSLTYNQVNKDMSAALVQDPDCKIIAFNPYYYFVVRDKIETDCFNANNPGANRTYMYNENNNPNFNYM